MVKVSMVTLKVIWKNIAAESFRIPTELYSVRRREAG